MHRICLFPTFWHANDAYTNSNISFFVILLAVLKQFETVMSIVFEKRVGTKKKNNTIM